MPHKFGLTTPPRDSEEMEFNDGEDNEISDTHFIQLLVENVKALMLILNEIIYEISNSLFFFHKKKQALRQHENNYKPHWCKVGESSVTCLLLGLLANFENCL